MLLELRAENYAVIDRAVASFGAGLNLLTGETGAGKSILIDALALLLGGKASSDVVRHGAERAVVSCVFESTPGASAVLDANGIDRDADAVLLRREIVAGGKGRIFINNQPATVGVLRQLAPELALVHSQGETLASFDQAQQRSLLDRFGFISSEAAAEAFAAWRATTSALAELESAEQDRLRMADLWRFQTREIQSANLVANEDLELEAEKRVLGNSEKLFASAMNAHELLYESEHAAETTLGAALKSLEELARYDDRFREPAQQLASAKATVEDIDSQVRDFAENLQASPNRLAEIEDRLAALDRLKRKYGSTVADVIAFGEEAAEKLAEVENRDVLLLELKATQEQHAGAYRQAASALSRTREQAAKKLEKQAEVQINDLAMRVRFKVQVVPAESHEHWTAHGWDQIQCLIATNAGEPLKPLHEIASGGELSRVMLALKVTVEETAAAGESRRKKYVLPRTLLFDEIDIGIGGRAAEAVGRKLKTLARSQQVLCITHLPQIAAFGDQHLLIEKTETKGRTSTGVRLMSDLERTREIARMLSGAKLTETSLKHAEQLIENSQ